MANPDMFDFSKFMPGLGLLQPRTGAAGTPAAIPGLAAWTLPTTDVKELDKRITDLKAVLFWLEQNASVIKATVQTLEVQKLTLHTLANMHMNMADVARAFTSPAHSHTPSPAPAPAAAHPSAPPATAQWPFGSAAPTQSATQNAAPSAAPNPAPTADNAQASAAPPTAAPAAPAMPDPLQWWDTLTRQLQHMAQQVAATSAPVKAPAPASVKKTTAKPATPKKSKPAAPTKASAKAAPAPAAAKRARTSTGTSQAKPRAKPSSAHWPLPHPPKT